jgi:hypothetical protein
LTATPHPGTAQQPWDAIVLNWIDASNTETGFRIERRPSGTANWTALETVGANTQSYNDLSVDPGTTYDYRVIAVGPSGESDPSNVATASAPASPSDGQPPEVTILSPADGDAVSRSVRIRARVTDNVGVNLVDVETVVNGGTVRLCRFVRPSRQTLRCRWNTNRLAPGAYPIRVIAADEIGNSATQTITVEVVERVRRRRR